MLSTNCAHSVAPAGSARPCLLLDAVGQLGDLRVDRPVLCHEGADFPVGVDDGGVVAVLITFAEVVSELLRADVPDLQTGVEDLSAVPACLQERCLATTSRRRRPRFYIPSVVGADDERLERVLRTWSRVLPKSQMSTGP